MLPAHCRCHQTSGAPAVGIDFSNVLMLTKHPPDFRRVVLEDEIGSDRHHAPGPFQQFPAKLFSSPLRASQVEPGVVAGSSISQDLADRTGIDDPIDIIPEPDRLFRGTRSSNYQEWCSKIDGSAEVDLLVLILRRKLPFEQVAQCH